MKNVNERKLADVCASLDTVFPSMVGYIMIILLSALKKKDKSIIAWHFPILFAEAGKSEVELIFL